VSPRQSILCPGCRKLISTSEARCPFCGIRHPAAGWRRLLAPRWLANPALLVKSLIGINVVLFALALLIDPPLAGMSLNPLKLLSPSDQALLLLGATGTIPIDGFGRWWTLLSANYLHAGILHIFFNMAALRQLAPVAVRAYGPARSVAIYTLGGVFGFFISYAAGVPLTIGASAAVCGLVGAILYYGRSRGGFYGMALYRQVGLWVVIMFAFGFLAPGINNWGHGGGIAAGALWGLMLGYEERRRESAFHRALAVACAGATAVILAGAVISTLYYRFSALL
jgi:rhomboid protease GluP